MGAYANGRLVYGYVRNDNAELLFSAIEEKWEEEHEKCTFEEMYQDLQQQHHVDLYSVGYAQVGILAAFDASTSAKGLSFETIEQADLSKTEEYATNIKNFLQAIGVDAESQPQWHILGYMD